MDYLLDRNAITIYGCSTSQGTSVSSFMRATTPTHQSEEPLLGSFAAEDTQAKENGKENSLP